MILPRSGFGLLLVIKVRKCVRVLACSWRVQVGFVIQIRIKLMRDLNDFSWVGHYICNGYLWYLSLGWQLQLRDMISVCHFIFQVKFLPCMWRYN